MSLPQNQLSQIYQNIVNTTWWGFEYWNQIFSHFPHSLRPRLLPVGVWVWGLTTGPSPFVVTLVRSCTHTRVQPKAHVYSTNQKILTTFYLTLFIRANSFKCLWYIIVCKIRKSYSSKQTLFVFLSPRYKSSHSLIIHLQLQNKYMIITLLFGAQKSEI